MTKHSAHHDTFTIERTYSASPAKVFRAWADLSTKVKWWHGPSEWAKTPHQMDFRVGGSETVSGGPPGAPVHRYVATYHDIVAEHRIVTAYDMYIGDTRISVSLATVELAAVSTGTRLVYTEQAVFLDGHDDAGSRERGTQALLDQLTALFQH